MSIIHNDLTKALNEKTDHHFCVSIIGGVVFVDISAEGFAEKVALIDEIEKQLEKLKS